MRTLSRRTIALGLLTGLILVGILVASHVQAVAAVQIDGRVAVDTDKDGKASAGDTGVKTLVELQKVDAGKVTSVTGVFTDAAGNFAFTGVADGDYQLVVWWSPGFVSPQADPARPQSLMIPLKAQSANPAQGRGLSFVVKPKPDESLIPWPVRTGQESLPVGLAVASVSLPSTGDGGAYAVGVWYWLLLATGVGLLLGSSLILKATRRQH